jgi:hypothetical protein
MAMLVGLNFTKDLLFQNLNLESDLANVIEALKDVNMHHSYLGAIAAENQNIQHNFNNINFSHVRRETNQVAHCLTNMQFLFLLMMFGLKKQLLVLMQLWPSI